MYSGAGDQQSNFTDAWQAGQTHGPGYSDTTNSDDQRQQPLASLPEALSLRSFQNFNSGNLNHDYASDVRHVDPHYYPSHYHPTFNDPQPEHDEPSVSESIPIPTPDPSYSNLNAQADYPDYNAAMTGQEPIVSFSISSSDPSYSNINAHAGYSDYDSAVTGQNSLASFPIPSPDPSYSNLNAHAGYPDYDPAVPGQELSVSFPIPSPTPSYSNINAHAGYLDYDPAVTGFREDPLANNSSIQQPSFNPNADDVFLDLNLDAQAGYYSRDNQTIKTNAGEDFPATFANIPGPSVHSSSFDSCVGNPSHPLNPYLPDVSLSLLNTTHPNMAQPGNVQVELTPTMTFYTSSTSHYHRYIASFFPEFNVPILSSDGISTMPDSEDENHCPLENLPEANPQENAVKIFLSPLICIKRGYKVGRPPRQDVMPSMAPSQPLVAESGQSTSKWCGIGPAKYDEDHSIHEEVIQMALDTIIRSVVNEGPFLSKDERKQQVHSALTAAACTFAEAGTATQWVLDNKSILYKRLSAPSTNLMSVAKKHAHDLVPRGYNLCLPLSSDKSEPKHQAQAVKKLIKTPLFPPQYIFKTGGSHPFENDVIRDVVQNTILELGYLP
ncbi:hypothetical protein EV702DRAFT_1051087 [Suillus placidus]|uniref:DUF6532 domain-containing protein n=1 Tax=Suillus placidus TaxID=48579 RepID=A0A9P6ZH28_9AGAM|nr:hypothetical protein EV702DRAFT_1051087 [Suillus placidus]